MSIRVGSHDHTLHSGGGTPDGPYFIKGREQAPIQSTRSEDRRYWGEPDCRHAGVPHNNANHKKKAKRKQAQASRRKNRR